MRGRTTACARRAHAVVRPGDEHVFETSLDASHGVRLVSYDRHATSWIRCDPASGERRVTIDARAASFAPGSAALAPGVASLAVRNAGVAPTGVFLFDGDMDAYHDATAVRRADRRPFLTFKDLRDRGVV